MGELSKKKIEVTDSSGRVVGSVEVGPNKREEGGWIAHLQVDSDRRGEGFGRQLLDEALTYIGDAPATLEVEDTNTHAIGMYERKGFQVVDRVSGKDGEIYLRMKRG